MNQETAQIINDIEAVPIMPPVDEQVTLQTATAPTQNESIIRGRELVNLGLDMINPVLASRADFNWRKWATTETEVKMLSEAWGAVLDKYFPNGLDMGEWLGAIIATSAVALPRIQQTEDTNNGNQSEHTAPEQERAVSGEIGRGKKSGTVKSDAEKKG